MRRSAFFLSLAAGLVATLALSAPTQAGSVYEVDAEVIVASGSATSATVEFVGGTVSGGVTILPSTDLPTPVTGTASGTTVVVKFPDAGPGVYDLEFKVTSDTNTLAGVGGTIAGSAGTQGGVAVLAVTLSVPEPTSMSLLGLGMAGFFAYRRLFKRPATV